MKPLLVEILRQKWALLTVVLVLLLINCGLGVVVSVYQLPALAELQTKWSTLRRQSTTASPVDAATLHTQGTAALEKLKARIPEKRDFARVLSELYESAASSAVEVGSITYRPLTIKGEALLSYQLSVSVSGSYAAVKSYLVDLQNNQELLVVESVAFSNGDLFVENVVMDLRLTIYLREGL
jgi:type IV pilus assembly protein PilO